MPEHQELKPGDQIQFVPKGDFAVPVVQVEAGRAIVLGGDLPIATPEKRIAVTWAFVLLPVDGQKTRLVSRCPGVCGPTWPGV